MRHRNNVRRPAKVADKPDAFHRGAWTTFSASKWVKKYVQGKGWVWVSRPVTLEDRRARAELARQLSFGSAGGA